jgi:glycosyltransferase involved in cell wall biosynthesis
MLESYDAPHELVRMKPRSSRRFKESAAAANGQSPLVSCVMVTRGVVPLLRHAAECFRRQSYPNRELVVVCGRDSDKVREFFHHAECGRVRLVRVRTKLALGNLRNIGISYASGEIIAQWDDDDLSDPDRLSHLVSILLSSGDTAAVFLSRLLLWWPARRLFAVSEKRVWENSMVAWRGVIPIYPALRASEDLFIVDRMVENHPVTLLESPSLYVYAVTGRNTWNETHFKRFFTDAKQIFADDDYDQVLQQLQQRIPIREYDEDIRHYAKVAALDRNK